MIATILLITCGCLLLIGIGHSVVRDFRVPALVPVLWLAAVVGLNFLPPLSLSFLSFSWGTLLFYLSALFFLFYRSSLRSGLLCFFITLLLAALLYGATFLSASFGSELFASPNLYYGFIVGFLAFLATGNARYSFVSSVLSLLTVSLLTQSFPLSLDVCFESCVVGGVFACTLFALLQTFLPKRPNKIAYYYEIGRLR